MSAQTDRDQVNAAISALVQHATTDPQYAAELSGDAVAFLKQSGVPDSMLAELLKAEGLEDAEVQAYNFDLVGIGQAGGAQVGGPGGPGAGGIIIGTICVGTCGRNTIVVGCTKSFGGGA